MLRPITLSEAASSETTFPMYAFIEGGNSVTAAHGIFCTQTGNNFSWPLIPEKRHEIAARATLRYVTYGFYLFASLSMI